MKHINCFLLIIIRMSLLNTSFIVIVNILDILHHLLKFYFGYNNVSINNRIMPSITQCSITS